MARIRSIKPEFFTSYDIVSLTPLSRLFYVSLWCEADREGRLNWNVKTLKMRYFPADNCDIQEMADELVNAGLIVIYEVDGKQYAEIPSFGHHQVINNREAESVLPPRVKDACKRVSGEGRKEGKGREGKSDDYSDEFCTFWTAYPRKEDKAKAWAAWQKAKVSLEVVLKALEWQKKSEKWLKEGGQFVPMPTTYINGSRWLDEPTATDGTPTKSWRNNPEFQP